MKILLNGNNLDFTLETETNAGQVLDGIETLAEENDATIVHIQINGKTILADEIAQCYTLPLDSVDLMEITTVQENDVYHSLKSLLPETEAVAAKLEEVPVLLQNRKDGQVAEILKTFADIFDTMCQLATLTCLFPDRFANLVFNGLSFQDFLKDFSPTLNEFESSLKSGDTVLTGDLAEWELKPRLESFNASLKDFN